MPKFTRKTIIFYRKALHTATDWQFNPALRYIYICLRECEMLIRGAVTQLYLSLDIKERV